jgi:hypothetical protein
MRQGVKMFGQSAAVSRIRALQVAMPDVVGEERDAAIRGSPTCEK